MEVLSRPLRVDMDDTLVKSDLLIESALEFLRKLPLRVHKLLVWLLEGRAALKHHIADEIGIDASLLPLNEAVANKIKSERERGRHCMLERVGHYD